MKSFIVLFFIIALCKNNYAQDNALSIYSSSPLNINPATTGTFQNNTFRFANDINREVYSLFLIPSNYTTVNSTFDISLMKGHLGLGNIFFYNNQSSLLRVWKDMLSISWNKNMFKDNFKFSIGLQGGLIHKRLLWDNLYFGDQIDPKYGYIFESTEPVIARQTVYFSDFNAGVILFSISKSATLKPWVGVASYHLFQPNEGIMGTSKLDRKNIVYAGTDILLNEKFKLTHIVLNEHQGEKNHFSISDIFSFETHTLCLKAGGSFNSFKDIYNSVSLNAGIGYAGILIMFEIKAYDDLPTDNGFNYNQVDISIQYKLPEKE